MSGWKWRKGDTIDLHLHVTGLSPTPKTNAHVSLLRVFTFSWPFSMSSAHMLFENAHASASPLTFAAHLMRTRYTERLHYSPIIMKVWLQIGDVEADLFIRVMARGENTALWMLHILDPSFGHYNLVTDPNHTRGEVISLKELE